MKERIKNMQVKMKDTQKEMDNIKKEIMELRKIKPMEGIGQGNERQGEDNKFGRRSPRGEKR